MKHVTLFESFEIIDPIDYGEILNTREINFLQEYNVMYPEWIKKDDNYYYVFNHRCENIKDLPQTYIHAVCSKYGVKNYKINDDYSINVDGKVSFYNMGLSKLPLCFNNVSGFFECGGNKLTTLEGSPKEVGGHFLCADNELDTLEGGPKMVRGSFYCSDNKLKTLEGGPESVGGDFYCSYNNLTTMLGSPKYVGGDFFCYNNPLRSVKYNGIVKGSLIYTQ